MIIAAGAMMIVSFIKGGIIGIHANSTVLGFDSTDMIPTEYDDVLQVIPQEAWQVLGWTMALVILLLTVFIVWARRSIWTAIGMIKTTSQALQRMWLMSFFPLLPVILSVLTFTYWVVGAALILTVDELTFMRTKQAIQDAVTVDQHNVSLLFNNTESALPDGVSSFDDLERGQSILFQETSVTAGGTFFLLQFFSHSIMIEH